MRLWFLFWATLGCAAVFVLGNLLHPFFYLLYILIAPATLLGLADMLSKKHTIVRNYPVLGRLRYVMEELRPKIYQYFIESDTDGAPLNRVQRSMVYQRAKKVNDTMPFGTPFDIYRPGHEWINHSMYPLRQPTKPEKLKVMVGTNRCKSPYALSVLNISAMSYGALSKTAVEALNWGAKEGGFAHNTGEGGISPYHLKHGGDLIWQIGTGYFGCRDENGNFNLEHFIAESQREQVKMIEIKLSQGAKPGHGGILPGAKNTPEIAAVRKTVPGTTVVSPPGHSAFSSPDEMMDFINQLRKASGGKPVGIKLCVGNIEEFEDLVKAALRKEALFDFVTIDGAEGGTGSAPPEFSSSIGQSLTDGLVAVSNTLVKYGIRNEVKILCSGKMISGFDLIRAFALGADACYSARAMMLALGCIQALQCHTNKCPTGIATQNPALYKGLDVTHKHVRIKNYHEATLESAAEIMAAAGIEHPEQLTRQHIWRRTSVNETKTYADLFPYPATETAQNIMEALKKAPLKI